ncbi:HigA protein (antitoxin to HigB) [Caballeronia glathei]|nr:HigA family addiction module antitoxin [Caballeronia glathei]CDY78037.1 HigA protein (antitoxin to HigB) [Caballeronia glathei]
MNLKILEQLRQGALQERHAWHEPFFQALRDPSRAHDTLAAARREVQDWEDRASKSEEYIAGWQAILTQAPEWIATLLDQQSHPLLQQPHAATPFQRPFTPEEIEASRLDRMGGRRKSKCRLSLDEKDGSAYCMLMAETDFSHPGDLVRQQCLQRFNLSVTEGARALGVTRQALTNLLTGKAGISPEMALRLELAFGGGAETWLQRQVLHDLAQARERLAELKVAPIVSERQTALF